VQAIFRGNGFMKKLGIKDKEFYYALQHILYLVSDEEINLKFTEKELNKIKEIKGRK